MARETIRSYFGFHAPKHRRSHGSKTLKIVVGTALAVVILGVVFTLIHHSPAVLPPSTTTTNPSATTTSIATRNTVSRHSGSTKTTISSPTTSTTAPTSTAPPTTSTPSLSPSNVAVQVFNGSGVSGQASSTSSSLQHAGFTIAGVSNAATYSYTASVIEYPYGEIAEAQLVQRYVGGATTLEASSTVPSSQVWLITGTDFTGITGS